MAKIKFFRAGDCSNMSKLVDIFSFNVYADRFYGSIDSLFIAHRNRYTTIIEIEKDLFNSLFKYNRKKGRYENINHLPFENQLAQFKITVLEH